MIYPLLVLVIILFEVRKTNGLEEKYDRAFSIALWWILILMATFRSASVGADTPGYIEDYESMPMMSFSEIRVRYAGYLGYYYPGKFLSLLGLPYQVWFGFVEGLYVYSLYRFVKKFSKDNIYSILIFVTNGLFTFSLAGQKQVMSMGLFLMAFVLFTEKRYLKMILVALWGGACHSSGLIFIFAFGLYVFRNAKFFVYVALGLAISIFALANVFTTQLVVLLASAIGSGEHFEDYLELDTSYTPVTLFFYIGSVIMAMFFIVGYWKKYKGEGAFTYGMCFMACAMQSLSGINPSLFRLALPFTPFFMILLPNTASTIRNKQKRILYNLAIWLWHICYFLITTKEPFEFM